MKGNWKTTKMPATERSVTRLLILPGIATLAGLVVLVQLGFWQVDRLAWKTELITAVESRTQQAPVSAPGPEVWQGADWAAFDYQPVEVTGRFLAGEVYYFIALTSPAGPVGGPGYFVYQPFETANGFIVMVNRGFVPESKRLPVARPESLAGSEIQTLHGLLRIGETPNALTMAPDPENKVWFARVPRDMAEALDLDAGKVAPYGIDLDGSFTPPSGLPQAGETILRFKNDHLGYALTWFGLAATLLGVFLAYAVSFIRKGRESA